MSRGRYKPCKKTYNENEKNIQFLKVLNYFAMFGMFRRHERERERAANGTKITFSKSSGKLKCHTLYVIVHFRSFISDVNNVSRISLSDMSGSRILSESIRFLLSRGTRRSRALHVVGVVNDTIDKSAW